MPVPKENHISVPRRDDALALVQRYTASESLRKHMLGVEAVMRAYAAHYGENTELWGITGLIHDFDYERYPNDARSPTEEHPSAGVRILRDMGYPEEMLNAIMGHAAYTGTPRKTLLARALFAVDELVGLVTATALVKPSRSVLDVEPRSVRKKMKDRAFARGVSREDITVGAAELGVELDEHIAFVVQAMQRSADIIGLRGTPGAGADPAQQSA